MAGTVSIGDVSVFPGVTTCKTQALKPLEEASEVHSAYQRWEEAVAAIEDGYAQGAEAMGAANKELRAARNHMLDECADVIQATCNLVASLGVASFEPYMERCRKRQIDRGRLDGGEVDG